MFIRIYKLTIRPASSKIGALGNGMLGVGMLDATSTFFIVCVLCKPKIKVRFHSIWKRFFILCFIWGRWSQGHSGSYEIFYSYGSLGTNKGKRNLWTEHLEFSCPGTTCWFWIRVRWCEVATVNHGWPPTRCIQRRRIVRWNSGIRTLTILARWVHQQSNQGVKINHSFADGNCRKSQKLSWLEHYGVKWFS